jgi:polyhydroxyalkanoate synthase
MAKSELPHFPVRLPAPEELATAWTSVFANSLHALAAQIKRCGEVPAPLPFDPLAPAWALTELAAALWCDPLRVLPNSETTQKWTGLWFTGAAKTLGQASEDVVVPQKGDRRFSDPAWSEMPAFDYLKQAYLLLTQQTLDLITSSDLDPEARTRIEFYTRQFLNAISPANFALTNPEALRTALETGGISLLSGLANMLADGASPSGLVQRRSADNFELGVSIAATPGSVVYQNDLMQLIQYEPTTPDVYKRPLLYVPPLVNKYYILDLQPKSSMIKWLVDQGHTVFVISWVNPGSELRDKGLDDYIRQGPVEALDIIERVTGERTIDTFGFCMGGTLLAIAAGYLEGKGQADRLGSVSLIGTLLDFSHTGEWATFYEPSHMKAVARHVEAKGVIGADRLQALFSVVRANDLIWSSVVNHYLLDRTAPASDLLYWFADGARIPEAFLVEYGTALLRDNSLCEPGGMTIDSVPIDLGKVAAPVTLISLKDDHVSGWQATYEGGRLFGGTTRFVLGGSGHNAGLVNPPSANKHGHWVNDRFPETAEQWLEGAEKREGSWWPAWQEWLAETQSAERVAARLPGQGGLPTLQPAPGSYARVR